MSVLLLWWFWSLYCMLYCRAVVGEVDEEMEHEMRFSDIKAEPLNPVVH